MSNDTIDTLNSFLRGEVSAVETYRLAIDRLHDEPEASTLTECLRCHEERALLLTREIERRGGIPVTGTGTWGAFARLPDDTAGVVARRSAVAALEEGEGHRRDAYRRDAPSLESDALAFFQQHLLPAQLRTHQVVSTLKDSLAVEC